MENTLQFLAEARELAGSAEILPNLQDLAARLAQAKDASRPLRVKFGVDPTSANLHLGHTVGLRALRRFQDRGHSIFLVIGGYTAQLGDPTGRNTARPPLSAEQVAFNAATYLNQVSLILDMERVTVVNNADWLSKVDLIKLAALVTANQLLAKDGFASRLEAQQPLGLHELLYPLLQGFDSVQIEADIEIGGTDQRFNILMGRHLQPHFKQQPQLAMLLPLLVGMDGARKMSKSFGNSIGLTDSPEQIFTKVMSLPDAQIVPFFELVSGVPGERLDALKIELAAGRNPKQAKEELGRLLITQFHNEATAQEAAAEWNRVHSQRLVPQDMPSHKLSAASLIVDLLKNSGLASSKNQARQLIAGGGVRLDGEKVSDATALVALPPPAGTILQVGRRQFIRLIA
ncbi:MAG: tyrosine--tRNA ligase [Cyanobacteria bacterium REEB67]|nr:tyrosine--tRNA ligase [Cyanobacteria bacterium REEB67]